jgi:CO/xanthine dehydrogenase FAD-binding subunit
MYDEFEFLGPRNLLELQDIINKLRGTVIPISGGTDLIIKLRENKINPDYLIDISQIQELNYIEEEKGYIKIGAAATFSQIADNKLIRSKAKCLALAAEQVGSVQIRNRGTVGGNIASASPAGDSFPPLNVLDAEVRTLGPQGIRKLSIEEIIIDFGKTALHENEIITSVEFPVPNENTISDFVKLGSRKTVSIARLSIAAAIEYDSHKNIIDSKVFLGALGKKAVKAVESEEILKKVNLNAYYNEKFVEEFIFSLTKVVDETIPGRYSQSYKREAVKGLGMDLLDNFFKNNCFSGGEADE